MQDNLMTRAENAIENREAFIYDIAAECGQIVDNVAHMSWFRQAVMDELSDEIIPSEIATVF